MAKETIRIGAVVSDFNYDIHYDDARTSKGTRRVSGAEITKVVKVPGVFDMALAIKKLLARKDIDGVITIGAVIEGETEHDDLIIQHAARRLLTSH